MEPRKALFELFQQFALAARELFGRQTATRSTGGWIGVRRRRNDFGRDFINGNRHKSTRIKRDFC